MGEKNVCRHGENGEDLNITILLVTKESTKEGELSWYYLGDIVLFASKEARLKRQRSCRYTVDLEADILKGN